MKPTDEKVTEAAERVRMMRIRPELTEMINEVYAHYLKRHRHDYYVADLEVLADAWLAETVPPSKAE